MGNVEEEEAGDDEVQTTLSLDLIKWTRDEVGVDSRPLSTDRKDLALQP